MSEILNKRLEELTKDEYAEIIREYLPDFAKWITDDMIHKVKTNKNHQKYRAKTTVGIVRSLAIEEKTRLRDEKLSEELEDSAFESIFLGSADFKKRNKPASGIISTTSVFLDTNSLDLKIASHKFAGKKPTAVIFPNTKYRIKRQEIELRSGTTLFNLVDASKIKELEANDVAEILVHNNNIEGQDKYTWVILKGRVREFAPLPTFTDKEITGFEDIAQLRYAGAKIEGGTPTLMLSFFVESDDGKNALCRAYFRKQKYGMPNFSLGDDFYPVFNNAVTMESDEAFKSLNNIYRNRPVIVIAQIYKKVNTEGSEIMYVDLNGIAVYSLEDDKDSWADTYGKRLAEEKMKKDVRKALDDLGDVELETIEDFYVTIAETVKEYKKDDVMDIISDYFGEE